MLIELAHYTIIFAVTAVGLQTLLLAPTLWSGGSAIAIKLGFRGACFTTALQIFSFLILLKCFAVHDFSLAVVFENFDSQSSLFYAVQAFCSSREGFFFTFLIFLSVSLLAGFSKKDLLTYQERGRYLFACGFLVFFLMVLMLLTASPFVRIEDPPFEGLGFNVDWRAPHKTLSFLLFFAAFSSLSVSFIKLICMYSKGREFVMPVLRMCLFSFLCLSGVLGINLMTGFTVSESADLWSWTPENSLLLSVFILMAGHLIFLFFCWRSKVFTNWIVLFSLLEFAFLSAFFFAQEYRLFSLSVKEVYFPNPVTALTAFAGILCFLLFFGGTIIKKSLIENNFSTFSRESFTGIAVCTLLCAGFCIGSLSLLPTLFMFMPDLPLRLLPNLFKNILLISCVIFTLFFFIALKKHSLTNGWIKTDWKADLYFWGTTICLICLFLPDIPKGRLIVLFTLPSLLISSTLFSEFSFKIPTSFSETKNFVKNLTLFHSALFITMLGIVFLSVSLSYASLNYKKTNDVLKIEDFSESPDSPCRIEYLTSKKIESPPLSRLVCSDQTISGTQTKILSGKTVFQWQDRPLDVKILQFKGLSARLIRLTQAHKDTLNIRVAEYPAWRLIGSGIFLFCSGLLFFIISAGKEKTS